MQLYPEMNKKGTVQVIKETFASKGVLGKLQLIKDFTEVILH